MTAFGVFAPRGDIRLNLRMLGPRGGRIDSLESSGRPVRFRPMSFQGRPVAFVGLLLAPGQAISLTAHMTTARGQVADPALQMTPGIERRAYDGTASSACS